MEQFLVPQFIEVESKIFGPITVRQFILMLVSFLSCVIWYKLFDFSLFLLISVVDLGIFALFAFVKVNGAPIHYFIINIFDSTFRSKIRVWSRAGVIADLSSEAIEGQSIKNDSRPLIVNPYQIGKHRLAELALIVNTGGVYKGKKYQENYEN